MRELARRLARMLRAAARSVRPGRSSRPAAPAVAIGRGKVIIEAKLKRAGSGEWEDLGVISRGEF